MCTRVFLPTYPTRALVGGDFKASRRNCITIFIVNDDNNKINKDVNHQVPENCPFVLTSPRSLEACRRAGVQVRR